MVACALTEAPEDLTALGVRDSKELSPARREGLEGVLKGRLRGYALVVLDPREIDARGRRSLNAVEGDAFVRAVIDATRSAGATALHRLQADACDTSEAAFRGMLVRGLARHAPALAVGRFEVEHKADARYPAVSAASILAKVERDRRVRALSQSVGCDIGSGYPADETTMGFLRDYIRANKDLPPFARRSWQPAKDLLRQAGGKSRPLDEFQ